MKTEIPEMTPALLAEMIATVVLAKGRRTTGGYFKCCCPAHDVQRPSLLIFVKADGRLSFRCFAGCPTRRIKIALRQRGFDLSRVKKQTVDEMQDVLLPADFARTRVGRVPGTLHPDHG
jgi:hypothetical protein